MGNNHPVENGMQWHTVLGVPYLPGSAVKGLVRAWMEQQEQPDFDKIHQWFGSDNKDPEKQTKTTQAGQIIFHDATPYQKVDVVLDVMTPHTGSWLTEGGVINAPADWHDPIPVVFLSCKRIKLFFSIAKMTHADETIDLKDVWNELVCALDFLGSGAKTSTGYGFMSEDSKINSDLKYEQELENKASEREKLSNEELKVQELIDLYKKDQEFNVSKGKGNTGALVGHLRDLLKEAVSWEEKDKIEIHTLAKDIYKYLNVDVKKKGKVKDLLKSLGV
jgi:CRISPR-associated protein Cmr6